MSTDLLVAEHLNKTFANGVKAVDDVSISINRGEIVGVVGESGCGKSTTGRLLLQLTAADGGDISFDGTDLRSASKQQVRAIRRKLQFIPQDPQTSLNPRLSVERNLGFNMRVNGVSKRDRAIRCRELIDQVGMPSSMLSRYPHELSGGQLQRIAIARAISTDPSLIICDEVVSALDKSVQAQILNLLSDLQAERNLALMFISHDLSVIEHIADRVVVMYFGRIVEQAPTQTLLANPIHPYTRALLAAIPGQRATRVVLKGEPPSPVDAPRGCSFFSRCSEALEGCQEKRPELISPSPAHEVACWLANESGVSLNEHDAVGAIARTS